MLLDFTVENFGPFKGKSTLSLAATSLDDERDAIKETKAYRKGVLKSAVIFGPNASGKTSIFKALEALQEILQKPRLEGESVPGYVPFGLSSETIGAPTVFIIRTIIDDTLYTYRISFLEERIIEESLHYRPNGRTIPAFIRGGEHENVDEGIMDKVSASSAYLTVSAGFNDSVASKVAKEILGIRIMTRQNMTDPITTYELSKNDPEFKRKVLTALDAADLGISDFTGNGYEVQTDYGKKGIVNILFEHQFPESDTGDAMRQIPLALESDGTKEFFALIGPVIKALDDGGAVMIDDFGSGLHPKISQWILNLFNSSENDNGAQMILSTHDATLMDIKWLLRRDQIRFTEKDRDSGGSMLYSLADFRGVRKNSDIMEDYMNGRFDAIPFVIGYDTL